VGRHFVRPTFSTLTGQKPCSMRWLSCRWRRSSQLEFHHRRSGLQFLPRCSWAKRMTPHPRFFAAVNGFVASLSSRAPNIQTSELGLVTAAMPRSVLDPDQPDSPSGGFGGGGKKKKNPPPPPIIHHLDPVFPHNRFQPEASRLLAARFTMRYRPAQCCQPPLVAGGLSGSLAHFCLTNATAIATRQLGCPAGTSHDYPPSRSIAMLFIMQPLESGLCRCCGDLRSQLPQHLERDAKSGINLCALFTQRSR